MIVDITFFIGLGSQFIDFWFLGDIGIWLCFLDEISVLHLGNDFGELFLDFPDVC